MRSAPAVMFVVAAVVVAACGASSKPPTPAPVIGNQVVPEPEAEAQPAPADDPAAAPTDPQAEAGVLGSGACGGAGYGGASYGCGAFASLTGTGDISSGFDDTNIYAGLVGDALTSQGDTATGNGGGGGGTGWGTIGTGKYGTIGHGSGTGSATGMHHDPKGPKIRIGQPKANAGLDKAIIRRFIKRHLPEILYCYEQQLVSDPSLGGKLVAKFSIGADGRVTKSTARGVNADVDACVAKVIQNIEFPQPKGASVVDVRYPLTFRPTGH